MLLSPLSSDSEPEDPTLLLAAATHSRLRRRPAVAVHARPYPTNANDSAPPTALICGAAPKDEAPANPADDDWWDARRPAQIPFLPQPLDNEPPPSRARPRGAGSTGCGAPVHAGARPARAGTRWVGGADGARDTVVEMEARYFARADAGALGLGRDEGCGCVVEGVGCAVCGNALGARHTPCRVHTRPALLNNPQHYTFLPGAVSPPLPAPHAVAGPSSQPAPVASTVTVTSTTAPIESGTAIDPTATSTSTTATAAATAPIHEEPSPSPSPEDAPEDEDDADDAIYFAAQRAPPAHILQLRERLRARGAGRRALAALQAQEGRRERERDGNGEGEADSEARPDAELPPLVFSAPTPAPAADGAESRLGSGDADAYADADAGWGSRAMDADAMRETWEAARVAMIRDAAGALERQRRERVEGAEGAGREERADEDEDGRREERAERGTFEERWGALRMRFDEQLDALRRDVLQEAGAGAGGGSASASASASASMPGRTAARREESRTPPAQSWIPPAQWEPATPEPMPMSPPPLEPVGVQRAGAFDAYDRLRREWDERVGRAGWGEGTNTMTNTTPPQTPRAADPDRAAMATIARLQADLAQIEARAEAAGVFDSLRAPPAESQPQPHAESHDQTPSPLESDAPPTPTPATLPTPQRLRRTSARTDLHAPAAAPAPSPHVPAPAPAPAPVPAAPSLSLRTPPPPPANAHPPANVHTRDANANVHTRDANANAHTRDANAHPPAPAPATAPAPPRPRPRFPSVHEQEAWLAADVEAQRRGQGQGQGGGRLRLRRASVPDLRRRAGAGEVGMSMNMNAGVGQFLRRRLGGGGGGGESGSSGGGVGVEVEVEGRRAAGSGGTREGPRVEGADEPGARVEAEAAEEEEEEDEDEDEVRPVSPGDTPLQIVARLRRTLARERGERDAGAPDDVRLGEWLPLPPRAPAAGAGAEAARRDGAGAAAEGSEAARRIVFDR
ncbi:hypothetical protein C8R44DRAFT_924576 [Mycena epipterygia]|nr:hypothetical protein C8R44DRAFT_924576 [Mycena epipterygia]